MDVAITDGGGGSNGGQARQKGKEFILHIEIAQQQLVASDTQRALIGATSAYKPSSILCNASS